MERQNSKEIDLSSDLAFKENLDLLEYRQRDNYRSAFAEAKRNETNAYRFRSRYFENALFVIYADAGNAQKFCRCGIPTTVSSKGACGIKRFCARCAYLDGAEVFERFRNSFPKGNFYSATLSYVQPLAFDDRNDAEHYWDAAFKAIEALKARRKIRGAVAVGEMSVRSYIPLAFNPHVHAVVDAADWDDDLDRQLEIEMQKYLQGQLNDYRTPNVRTRPIEDAEDFERMIRYPFKAMDLRTPYETVLNEQGRTPNVLRKLNEDVKEFIRSTTEFMKDGANGNNLKLLRYYGTMHSQNSGFIGQTRKAIKKKRKKTSVLGRTLGLSGWAFERPQI